VGGRRLSTKTRCSRQEIIDEDKAQQVAECVAEDKWHKLEEVVERGGYYPREMCARECQRQNLLIVLAGEHSVSVSSVKWEMNV